MTILEESLEAGFVVDSFSTYTITWGSATNTTTNLTIGFYSSRIRTMNVTVHYVDESGNPITRPSGINTTTSVSTNNASTSVTFGDSLLGNGISGYTYVGAHYGSFTGTEVTSVTAYRSYSSNRVTYYNGGSTVGTYTGTTDVYLVYSGSSSDITVHYGYMSGGTFVEFSEDEDGDVPAGTTVPKPSQYGDQWDLEKTIPGYRYVTTRLNNPTDGREISSLLNTDPPYKDNVNNTFENANLSAHRRIPTVQRPQALSRNGVIGNCQVLTGILQGNIGTILQQSQ